MLEVISALPEQNTLDSLFELLGDEMEKVVLEIQSGQYRSLTDCPSYKTSRIINECIYKLEFHYYGEQRSQDVKSMITDFLYRAQKKATS